MIVEGLHPTPQGGLACVRLTIHPQWKEPAVAHWDYHQPTGTPLDHAQAVRQSRPPGQVSTVALSAGRETLHLLDGYTAAGLPVAPAPPVFTEAMGVMRAVALLRRSISSPRFGTSKRLLVTKGCRALLAGLEQVGWDGDKPLLEGPGADVVRALAAAMIVLPPEPPDPVDVMTRLAREVMPRPVDWDRRAAEPDLEGDVDYWGSFV